MRPRVKYKDRLILENWQEETVRLLWNYLLLLEVPKQHHSFFLQKGLNAENGLDQARKWLNVAKNSNDTNRIELWKVNKIPFSVLLLRKCYCGSSFSRLPSHTPARTGEVVQDMKHCVRRNTPTYLFFYHSERLSSRTVNILRNSAKISTEYPWYSCSFCWRSALSFALGADNANISVCQTKRLPDALTKYVTIFIYLIAGILL